MPKYQAVSRKESKGKYSVITDAPPEAIKDVALEIFTQWVRFALGSISLEGHRIKNPTGRYSKSIQIEPKGPNRIAILSEPDPKEVPEAYIIEFGHEAVDLKTKPGFWKGRHLPIHRAGGVPFAKGHKSPGYYLYASRDSDFSGMASVGTTGWILPPFPAMSPAKILSHIAARKLKGL